MNGGWKNRRQASNSQMRNESCVVMDFLSLRSVVCSSLRSAAVLSVREEKNLAYIYEVLRENPNLDLGFDNLGPNHSINLYLIKNVFFICCYNHHVSYTIFFGQTRQLHLCFTFTTMTMLPRLYMFFSQLLISRFQLFIIQQCHFS